MNFDKFNIRLYFLIISSILVKFQENKKSIAMSSINYLISSLYSLKLCMKNKFIDRMVNIIRFEELKKKKCIPMVTFNFKIYNLVNFLVGVCS